MSAQQSSSSDERPGGGSLLVMGLIVALVMGGGGCAVFGEVRATVQQATANYHPAAIVQSAPAATGNAPAPAPALGNGGLVWDGGAVCTAPTNGRCTPLGNCQWACYP